MLLNTTRFVTEPPLPIEKWPLKIEESTVPIELRLPIENYYSVATSTSVPHCVFAAAVFIIRKYHTHELLETNGDIDPQDNVIGQKNYINGIIYHAKPLLQNFIVSIVEAFNTSTALELLRLITDVVYVRLLFPNQPVLFDSEGEIQFYATTYHPQSLTMK